MIYAAHKCSYFIRGMPNSHDGWFSIRGKHIPGVKTHLAGEGRAGP